MAKAPAFQFYVRDWLSDPQLKMASASSKGIWIDLLCYMWEAPEKGKLSGTKEQLTKLVGVSNGEFDLFLEEVDTLVFCDISVTDNEIITLCNRRMFRDEKERKNNRLRQQRFRDKQKSNEEITPPSSSSSSSSLHNADNFHFKIAVKIPSDFYLTDQMRDYAKKQGLQDESHLNYLFESFVNWWSGNGKKKQNWTKTFYNWILKDKKEFNQGKYIIKVYE